MMANEKRLIDGNALINLLKPLEKYSEIFKKIFLIIQTCPTVDAVEVVHGHWVSLTECANAGVYCSACNKKVYKEDYAWCNRKNKLRSNYCPNCGADMRGEQDGK